jgi:cyclopropane fatty-acyl-phospholipid synthase-like methyltransferase
MPTDHFAHRAATFEQNPHQVDNVRQIAATLQQRIPLNTRMHLMDFGAGTGLLLEHVAPAVGRITAVDVSPAMNTQLGAKLERLGCPVDILAVDLTREPLHQRFDGIISSMTLHHIQDIPALLKIFYGLLNPGGFIGLADLDTEDGSFHTDNTGVHHLGLDRAQLASAAREAGFGQIEVDLASIIRKPERDYPVFLLSARRP